MDTKSERQELNRVTGPYLVRLGTRTEAPPWETFLQTQSTLSQMVVSTRLPPNAKATAARGEPSVMHRSDAQSSLSALISVLLITSIFKLKLSYYRFACTLGNKRKSELVLLNWQNLPYPTEPMWTLAHLEVKTSLRFLGASTKFVKLGFT